MLEKCRRCDRKIWLGRAIICKVCIAELRPGASEIGPDRFWLPMTLVPLGLLAMLVVLGLYAAVWR